MLISQPVFSWNYKLKYKTLSLLDEFLKRYKKTFMLAEKALTDL